MSQAYKVFARVWSAYTKALFRQVMVKNQVVICPLFGLWTQANNLENRFDSKDNVVCFMPSA